MKQRNLVSINFFCEKYSLNKNSFESRLARRCFPEGAVDYTGGRGQIKINENYFLYRKKSIERMWTKACDNYYVLNEHLSDYALSKILHELDDSKSAHCWNIFLYESLFSPPPEKITHTKMTRALYLFLRYSNLIIRRGDK